ncbi:hypothetical protein RB594_009493 [Gaeumannomyces avenae]
MVSMRFFVGAVLAAASVSAVTTEDPLEMASRLLKRQEPGSPAYNCHDTCGQALRQGRFSGDARCSNDVFKTNYGNCLKCAGPDNANIWSMYGRSLEAFGRACGLSTTPASGKQDPVPPAIPAIDPAGSAQSSTPAPTAAPATSTRAPAPSGSVRSTSSSSGGNSSTAAATSTPRPSSPPVPAGAADFLPNAGMAALVYAAVFAAAHML